MIPAFGLVLECVLENEKRGFMEIPEEACWRRGPATEVTLISFSVFTSTCSVLKLSVLESVLQWGEGATLHIRNKL